MIPLDIEIGLSEESGMVNDNAFAFIVDCRVARESLCWLVSRYLFFIRFSCDS